MIQSPLKTSKQTCTKIAHIPQVACAIIIFQCSIVCMMTTVNDWLQTTSISLYICFLTSINTTLLIIWLLIVNDGVTLSQVFLISCTSRMSSTNHLLMFLEQAHEVCWESWYHIKNKIKVSKIWDLIAK